MSSNSIHHPLRIAMALLSTLLAGGVDAATIEDLLPDPQMLGEWVLDADRSDDASQLPVAPRGGRLGPPPSGRLPSGATPDER